MAWVQSPLDPAPFLRRGHFPVFSHREPARDALWVSPVLERTPSRSQSTTTTTKRSIPAPATGRSRSTTRARDPQRACPTTFHPRMADGRDGPATCLYNRDGPDGGFHHRPPGRNSPQVIVASPCSGHGFKFRAPRSAKFWPTWRRARIGHVTTSAGFSLKRFG